MFYCVVVAGNQTLLESKVGYVPRVGEYIAIAKQLFEVKTVMYDFSPEYISRNIVVISVKPVD